MCGMDAIAAWRALLGTTSVAETCAAMMQARESAGSYDPQTGRNAYTTAYEGLEAALSDTAAESVSMMSDSGEVQDDPMTAARNRTRTALGLPPITNDADAAVQAAMLSGEAADATRQPASTRIAWTPRPSEGFSPPKPCVLIWTNARNASTNRSCQGKANRIKEIDYG